MSRISSKLDLKGSASVLKVAAQGAQQIYNWSVKCGSFIYKSANGNYNIAS
jgi:hypothetical protein